MRKLTVKLDSGVTISVMPPTVEQFYEKRLAIKNNAEMYAFIAEVYSRNAEGIAVTPEQVLKEFTTDDYNFFLRDYIAWVMDEREKDPNS